MKLTIGRSFLMASAAVLVLGVAGMQSRAEAPQDADGPVAQPFELAQAEQQPEGEADAEDGEEEEIPDLSEEVLEDPGMIALGEEVWQSQCRSCHGRAAYPGKAPRLRPSRYDPEFVYHRVTFGFRGMPAWEDIFSEEERVAVTAYILSRQFSP